MRIITALAVLLFAADAWGVVVTTPTQYQMFQRDREDTGSITIIGTYTGTPIAIEARFNGGPWEVVDHSPDGNTFTGELVAAYGVGDLDVRGINDDEATVTVANVRIGDIYWLAGQSNAKWPADNPQPTGGYPVGAQPVTVDESGNWSLYDESGWGYGTGWPAMAINLHQANGVPVGLINTSVGGTTISQHQSDSAYADPGPWTARYVSTAGVTKVRAILFHQGENDCTVGLAPLYLADLRTAAAHYKGLFDNDPPFLVARIHEDWQDDANTASIQAQQATSWSDEGIYQGADMMDYANTNVHFTSDADVSALGLAWSAAVKLLDGLSGKLLQSYHLTYEGAFLVPSGNLGGDSSLGDTLRRGGIGITYNAAGNSGNGSLILMSDSASGLAEKLAVEISIPVTPGTGELSTLPRATVVQVPSDVGNGEWQNLQDDGSLTGNAGSPGGLLVYNNKLIGSAFGYYDANTDCYRSHFSANLDWATSGTGFSGFKKVGLNPVDPLVANGGLVGGYMAHVPPEWQTALGYPALTGKGGVAVISRSSMGPAAWGFNPDDVTTTADATPVTATMLVGYPVGYPTMGTYEEGALYNQGTDLGGIAFPVGSDTVLFFGRLGLGYPDTGEGCYGYSTDDPLEHDQPRAEDSANQCYDLEKTGHGNHAYPYDYHVWAYDAQDFADVKAGNRQPWSVVPYADWSLDLVYDFDDARQILGVAYNPTSQELYVTQNMADTYTNSYDPYPVVHVYSLDLDAAQPTCSANYNYCPTESECTEAGWYYYGEDCHGTPETQGPSIHRTNILTGYKTPIQIGGHTPIQ